MLDKKIKKYKQKYYINLLIRGSIFTITVLAIIWLIVSTAEYFAYLNTWARVSIFYIFLLSCLAVLYAWILKPLLILLNEKKQFSNRQAARYIGNYFPNIRDKLLNTLQLKQSKGSADLIEAAISKNVNSFKKIDFSKAINYSQNKQYLKYLIPAIFPLIVCIIWVPELLTESTKRIIFYKQKFEPQAPFSFNIQNQQLQSFRNENFKLKLHIYGRAIPDKVFITTSDNRKLRMASTGHIGKYEYLFKNVQEDINFYFEASGFSSKNYQIAVFLRPIMKSFTTFIDYPDYTGKTDEQIDNTGNLIIPEGTHIKWDITTSSADSVKIFFTEKNEFLQTKTRNKKHFFLSKIIKKSQVYQIQLTNQYSKNKDIIEHYLEVIPDQYPSITMQRHEDTILYNYIILAGNIGDDYGISSLKLNYKIFTEMDNQSQSYQKVNLPFNRKVINQSFFYSFNIDSLLSKQGKAIEYFVEVKDNDGVNGFKSSRSAIMMFHFPKKENIKRALEKDETVTKEQFGKTIDKAKELKYDLETLQKRLKSKRKIDWKDKKAIEELLLKNKRLTEEVNKLQDLYKKLNERQNKFGEISSENLKKAKNLQQLMNEVLDEETQKLYDQLNQLLEENMNSDQIQDLLENLDMKQKNLGHDLDRTLELFERLKFDIKSKEIIKNLQELSQKQLELSEKTDKLQDQKTLTSEEENENLDKRKQSTISKKEIETEQKNVNKRFEGVGKNFEDLKKLNEKLKTEQDLAQFEKPTQQIKQLQKQILDQLKNNQKEDAIKSQRNSAQKMKKMAEKIQEMQKSGETIKLMENYNDLRQILDNLMFLSFSQEDLMKSFRKIKRIDPEFVELSQKQLKIKEDAQLVADSLIELSKRVFQLQSFITREVTLMNKYIDESLEAIRKRIPYIVSGKQQFSMTSINNLALLLNDVLQQMQSQISLSMSGKQMNQKQIPNLGLSDLQKQLNQQIKKIKGSGKSGMEMFKELAKLAIEQEMIRNALKNMKEGKNLDKENEKNKNRQDKAGKYSHILNKMEQTEEDLINKKITQETILRQKEILTRLFESEKASRERKLNEEREAKTAEQDYEKINLKTFSEYLKLKQVQIELLKTLPASLTPYYKKEVNEYFEMIKNN